MLVAFMMACGIAARAEETELDPARVSQSLKANFQLGSTTTKQALNANTVTLISGTIGGTYVQFGADLASVLDDGNKLRVLPIVGRGSVQSVADILFLQGVDLGIVRADTLDYLEKVLAAYNWAPNTDRYRKLTQFVDALFTKFPTFQNPPFHPKWTEVSLAAPLAGWTRFPAAQQWLDSHGVQPMVRSRFDESLKQNPAADNVKSEADREALFKQFQAWQADHGAQDTSNARAQLRNDQKLR